MCWQTILFWSLHNKAYLNETERDHVDHLKQQDIENHVTSLTWTHRWYKSQKMLKNFSINNLNLQKLMKQLIHLCDSCIKTNQKHSLSLSFNNELKRWLNSFTLILLILFILKSLIDHNIFSWMTIFIDDTFVIWKQRSNTNQD
jgi:hypothetical protein